MVGAGGMYGDDVVMNQSTPSGWKEHDVTSHGRQTKEEQQMMNAASLKAS